MIGSKGRQQVAPKAVIAVHPQESVIPLLLCPRWRQLDMIALDPLNFLSNGWLAS